MNDPSGQGIGHYVRDQRRRMGMTQVELAERIGMSQRWVSEVERGLVVVPRQENMLALARVFSVAVEDLYVAAGVASSQEGARRVIAVLGSPDSGDRTLDLLMDGARKLTPDGRRALLKHLEAIAELDRLYNEDRRRDGP